MVKRQRQEGEKKEAPLAVVGSKGVGEQYKKTLTLSDEEYLHYSELLQGFFQKITRWLKIAQAEEYQENEKWRGFSVFSEDNTLSIKSGTSMTRHDPANKVLEVRNQTYLNEPEYEFFGEKFIIRPAPAGKHLLVDIDKMLIEEVTITVQSQCPNEQEDDFSMQRLEIQTQLQSQKPEKDGNLIHRDVYYHLRGDTLRVSNLNGTYRYISDEYAVHLIDTIDGLIPGSTSLTPQPERRATQELGSPKRLPPARRTRPLGR